jgi:hypothetical protein
MYNDPRDSAPHRWPFEKDVADMMYRMEAEYILDLEDKEKAVQRIVDFQSEIEYLHRYFKAPLLLFLDENDGLIDQHLGKSWRRCKDGKYRDELHCLTIDLLNLVYCLAGRGPIYSCPIEQHERRVLSDYEDNSPEG